MIPLKIPEMPVIPVIAEDNTRIVIVSTEGGHLSLKKPISERWAIHLSPEGKTTGIQLKLKRKNTCQGCSYQHYDAEGGTFCGLAEYAKECPRGGGLF